MDECPRQKLNEISQSNQQQQATIPPAPGGAYNARCHVRIFRPLASAMLPVTQTNPPAPQSIHDVYTAILEPRPRCVVCNSSSHSPFRRDGIVPRHDTGLFQHTKPCVHACERHGATQLRGNAPWREPHTAQKCFFLNRTHHLPRSFPTFRNTLRS